jgi:NADH-quinone oxidoreductase subunit N
VRSYLLIAPELVMLATALVAMFADVLPIRGRRVAAWIGAAGAAAAAVVVLAVGPGSVILFGGMLRFDGIAVFARVATAGLTAAYLLWLAGNGATVGRAREATALVLLAATGGMVMSGARDLVLLFLAMEAATMPAYVLIGFDRGDERGLEGALKYFLLSMVTSLVMLYGMAFLYGMSGTTALDGIHLAAHGSLGLIAAVLTIVGLLAKLSAAPFHYWSPDAYAGAPAFSVAFVSSVPKIAGVVALVRLLAVLGPQVRGLAGVLLAVAVLSMLIGNLAAYPQKDVRRLMAYSGVAHVGYILLALAAGTAAGSLAAVLYAVAYAVPSMAVMLVVAEEGPSLDDLDGLVARRPFAAWSMLVFLVSLVGVPPLVGFFGKLYMFSTALDAGLVWPVVLALALSAVSAGYYFSIVRAVFLGQRPRAVRVHGARNRAADVAIAVCLAATVLLGVLAGPLLAAMGFTLQ